MALGARHDVHEGERAHHPHRRARRSPRRAGSWRRCCWDRRRWGTWADPEQRASQRSCEQIAAIENLPSGQRIAHQPTCRILNVAACVWATWKPAPTAHRPRFERPFRGALRRISRNNPASAPEAAPLLRAHDRFRPRRRRRHLREAVFEAYRKLNTFDESRPLGPWLFRIAHNRCIDFLRRRQVRQEAEAAAAEPDAILPGDPPGRAVAAVERLVVQPAA